MTRRAHAWRSGLIEFRGGGEPCPRGALSLPDVPLAAIEVRARRSYDGETLLVPGVPEAENDADALAAFEAFFDFLDEEIAA
ncbi:MAG: host nuclease inhibitor protein [Defluviicoccus sp.]|nr:host nuclease inhibitor protein [Defluviicoccus sp.]